jgi:SAM-dependent methyltransferase
MNMWDERFDTPEYVYGTTPNHFLEKVSKNIPAGSVLCIGEGEGRNAVFLAERGHAVTAVDASSVGLRKAAELAASRGVSIETVHADLADYPIEPERWAGIVSIFCHVPPALRAKIHRTAVAGLLPGGAFVLEGYSPRQLEYRTGGPSTLELLMDLETIKSELAGLDFERAEEIVRRIGEGEFHKGDGSVVQILGFKPQF